MTGTEARTFLRHYLDTIEKKDVDALSRLLDDDITRIEHPNRFAPQGNTHNKTDMLAGLRKGATILETERYTIEELFTNGERVACRLRWVASLANNTGALSGHIALFFTLQDDRITHLIHYDCIAP